MLHEVIPSAELELRRPKKERIDREFEEMAGDEEYLREMVEVDAAWNAGTDEALRIYLAQCGEPCRYP